MILQLSSSSIHLLPGRVRLEIPGLYKNSLWALALEQAFGSLPGVEKVKANSLTGKLLLHQQLITLGTV